MLALLFAGFGGSVTHCLTMCSVFVLGQMPSDPGASLIGKLLLPYHFGRATTYSILGAAAGYGLHFLMPWSGFSTLRHLVLGVVATLFLTVFAERLLRRVGIVLPFRLSLTVANGCALNDIKNFNNAGALRRYGLGLSLGLLPCPLVLAALMAVSVSASPLVGGIGMALFAIGTTPALVGLGFAGSNILKKSPRLQDGLTLAALGTNGVILLALAVG